MYLGSTKFRNTKFSTHGAKFSTAVRLDLSILNLYITRRLEKQRRVGAAKPLDPGDTGRR
eukprot:SAG31_NODE_17464_length_669_cov_3.136842_1_plen_60_part_00